MKITETASPSNTGITTIVKNADYNKHPGTTGIVNSVVDVPTAMDQTITEYTDVFKKTSTNGRASIKY